jgi:hypothetical protein
MLMLWPVSYLDSPVRMERIRFRRATEAETAALCQRLPPGAQPERRYHELRESHLIIEHAEGQTSILAPCGMLWWEDEYRAKGGKGEFVRPVMADLDGPLWPGGPPLAEL